MINKYNYDIDDWDYICRTDNNEYAYVYAVIDKESSVHISIYRTNEFDLESHVKNEDRILKFKLYNLPEYLKKRPEYCFKYFGAELNKMAIEINFLGYE